MENNQEKSNGTEQNYENKDNIDTKKDDKKEEKKSRIVAIGEIGLKGFEKYLDYRNKKDENEKEVKIKELEIQERIMKEKLEFYQMKIKEMEEKDKKKEKEEEDKKNKLKDGTKEWNEKEKKLIKQFLNEIDFNYIKNILENKDLNIIKENNFENELSRIFTEDLKDNEIIKEKHNSIFQSIKNNIKEIQSLNFLIAGRSGVGKSALTNAILKCKKADEGENIDSQTSAITLYSNPNEVPGIMIYDTIGVEATNNDRNIEKIKIGIKETFDQNLNNPERSLHGILYCIKNGNGDNRIEAGEIQFIKDLNKIYGDGDIVIIVFTQSINKDSKERKRQLKEKLNNENIEIIQIQVKNYTLNAGNQNIKIKAFGRKELINAMKNKCKGQLIKCNLKQIAKKNIKEKFLKDIQTKSREILNKIKNYEFENTFDEECKYILSNLICDLNLDFENLDILVFKEIENIKRNIKVKILEENKETWVIKLYKEFRAINNIYDKQLDDSSITDDLMEKFDEYFSKKIGDFIKKIVFAKISKLFIERIKIFFGKIIGENVLDEEIKDIVDSNIEKVFKKINEGDNDEEE